MGKRLPASTFPQRISKRLGGESFLGPWVALGALVVSFITSVATFSANSWLEVLLWSVANWVSFGIVFIPILMLWMLRRAGHLANIGLGSVLAISAGVGFVKTTTVSIAFSIFSGDALAYQDLALRGFAGAILGIVLLPSLTLAVDSISELRKLRRIVNQQELLSYKSEDPDEPEHLLRNLDLELGALVESVSAGSNPQVAEQEIASLRDLISNHVRPASKAFWHASEMQLEKLSWPSLLRIAASRDIWIPVVVIPLISGFSLGAIQGEADAGALAHALLLMPVLTLVLLIMNRLEKWQRTKPGVWFVATMLIAGPVAWFATGVITDQDLVQNLGWLLGYTFWLTMGSLGTSLARLILQERRDLIAQLSELKLNLSQVKPAEVLESRKRANQLHGEVQSRLVANVFLAESGASIQRSELVSQLEQIQKLIREAVPEHKDFAQEIEQLCKTWSGFVEIEISEPLPELEKDLASRALAVIEEGIQNAYRHGLADMCRLELEPEVNNLRIRITDNGVGVRAMESGVGSALFASEDPRWAITNASGGGAVVTIRLANQVKTP